MEIEERTYEFFNSSDARIHCVQWSLPASKSNTDYKGIVFIIHGAGEHCGWYKDSIAPILLENGFAVYSQDHIGHGRSDGDRVHIDKFSTYTDDCIDHLKKILENNESQLPLFLIGHSMGGAIAILVARQHPDWFSGVVLIGPMIIPNPETASAIRVGIARAVAFFRPQTQIAKIEGGWVSRREDVIEKYNNDPLVYHDGLKAKWAVQALDACTDIQRNLDKITFPFLTMHGTEDKLCHVDSSKVFYEKAASKDKEIKLYEDCYHQLHNELEEDAEKVKRDLLDWILKHC